MPEYDDKHFQTPAWVADIIAAQVEATGTFTYLEPSPGSGNLCEAMFRRFRSQAVEKVPRHGNFWKDQPYEVDWIVANPPFEPFDALTVWVRRFFEYAGNVVTLLPWYFIINSSARSRLLIGHGLERVIALPRSAFRRVRVQTCVVRCLKDYEGPVTLEFAFHPKGRQHEL